MANVTPISNNDVENVEVAQPPKEMNIRQLISQTHGEALVNTLENLHIIDSFILIRDNVSPEQVRELKADAELYRRFKELKSKAKQAWDYDHRPALMADVNRATTNVYTILLKMIKTMNEEIESLKGTVDDLRIRGGLNPIYDTIEDTKQEQGADTGKNDTTTDL